MRFQYQDQLTDGKPDLRLFEMAVDFFAGPVLVTVEDEKHQRSNAQNRYYWGVVVNLLKDALWERGYDYLPDEVHEAMKWKFLQRHEDGLELPTVRSTTRLTTTEFNDYIENIQRWAAEYLHLSIPDPQEDL